LVLYWSMTIKPLRPSEIAEKAKLEIPNVVIQAVNTLLIRNYRQGSIKIYQDELIKEIQKIDDSFSSADIFSGRMLDFEDVFNDFGWRVVYDKPAYCENYEPNFTFTPIN
jgi:hypothetical protein